MRRHDRTVTPPPPLDRVRAVCIGVLLFTLSSAIAAGPPDERVIIVSHGRLTEIPYSAGLTASKAVLAGGGYADFSRTPVSLIRCAHSTRLNMKLVIEHARRDLDVELQPWDIITIGGRSRAK